MRDIMLDEQEKIFTLIDEDLLLFRVEGSLVHMELLSKQSTWKGKWSKNDIEDLAKMPAFAEIIAQMVKDFEEQNLEIVKSDSKGATRIKFADSKGSSESGTWLSLTLGLVTGSNEETGVAKNALFEIVAGNYRNISKTTLTPSKTVHTTSRVNTPKRKMHSGPSLARQKGSSILNPGVQKYVFVYYVQP
eukprot:Nk52_evm111s224 gene=Nk52_evmTU111s224